MSKTGDDTARNLRAYLASEHPVVEPIPIKKDDKKKPEVEKPTEETPKNDDFNEYDYSDDKELDDKEW